jgi:CRP-like cAMP-binding protein
MRVHMCLATIRERLSPVLSVAHSSLIVSEPSVILAIPRDKFDAALRKLNPEPSKLASRVLTFIEMVSPTSRMQMTNGQTVFRQGDRSAPALYIVKQGNLQVLHSERGKPDVVVSELSSGECFGYVSLLAADPTVPKAFTVKCVSDSCEIMAISGDDFHRLLDHSVEAKLFMHKLSKRRSELSMAETAKQGVKRFRGW